MPSMHESLLSRYVALPGLLLTSAVGIALIYGNATNQSDSGAFFHYVSENRASSQLVVQILSHLFGAIIILTLTTVLNFRTRILLTEKAISLHSVSWWNQLCNQRLNFGLPWPLSLLLVLFYGLMLAPAALWAGAITPLIVTKAIPSTIRIPKYSPDPDGSYWNQTNEGSAQYVTTLPSGVFSFYPIIAFGGQIMSTASTATSRSKSVNQTHPKYDNTRYSFSGRSYGVGSSVGLVGDVGNVKNLAQYSYIEHGYEPVVYCHKNETSEYRIYYTYSTGVSGEPVIYNALGPLPNSAYGNNTWHHGAVDLSFSATPEQHVVLSFYSIVDMVSIAALSANGRNMIAIASMGEGSYFGDVGNVTRYLFLDKIQCEAFFRPSSFLVDVDVSQRLINVTKLGDANELNFDPTVANNGSGPGIITQSAIHQVDDISIIFTTMLTSVIGDALVSNVQNAYVRAGVEINNYSDPSINLFGVAQAFESMLDDILLGISGAQLMLAPDGNVSASVNATVHAVRIGEGNYIYGIAALNFAVVALFMVEAVRTGGWKRLTSFNYNDLTSVILATSIGGSGIGDRATRNGVPWYPKSSSQMVGKARIRVDKKEKGVALFDVGATTIHRKPVGSRTSSYYKTSSSHYENSEDIPLV